MQTKINKPPGYYFSRLSQAAENKRPATGTFLVNPSGLCSSILDNKFHVLYIQGKLTINHRKPLMIEVTEFKLGAPDSDGDMRPDTNVNITNTTDETIRQVRHSTAFLGHDGGPVSFNTRNTEDVTLDPGETTSISPYGYLKSVATAGGRDDVKMVSSARLMKRDFIKLGSVDTPAPEKSVSKTMSVGSDVIEGDVLVSVLVTKPDDDGESYVEVKVLMKNATDQFIEEAQVKAQLIDEEDAQIDDSYTEENIPANGYGMFETSFYGLKKSKLRDTTVKIGLYIYSEMESGSAEKVSEPDDG